MVQGLIEWQEAYLAIGLILIRNRAEIVEQPGMGLFPGFTAFVLKLGAEMLAHQRMAVHRFWIGPGDQFQFFKMLEH